jgi:hypothetical protein
MRILSGILLPFWNCINIYGWNYSEGPAHLKNYQLLALFWSLFQAKFFKSLLVKCDSQLTTDVIPYNNRNDGGPAAGLLSLVEVPVMAIVPFMVNAFDYVTFIHRLTWDLPGKFWKKPEIINFHNYWFLIWPSYFNLSEIIRKRTVFSADKFTEVRHRVHNYWIWITFYR